MFDSNATDARPVNSERAKTEEPRAITLTPIQASLVDQLVEREAKRLGETPERARRMVEIGIVTRGIAALQEDGQ